MATFEHDALQVLFQSKMSCSSVVSVPVCFSEIVDYWVFSFIFFYFFSSTANSACFCSALIAGT